jgi:OmpA-OmpF porin, OOP family
MNKKIFNKILLFTIMLFTYPSFGFSQSGYVATVYFKRNSTTINEKYKASLKLMATQMQSDSFIYVRIFAFTDTVGSEEYNDKLAKKRADAVYNYLNSRAKIDASKVYMTWPGETPDIYDLHFPEAHDQQRCVDIWISFYNKSKQPGNK